MLERNELYVKAKQLAISNWLLLNKLFGGSKPNGQRPVLQAPNAP